MTVERPHHAHWPERLPRELSIPETSLWFNLEVAAARYPAKTANWFCGRAQTYAALRDDALALSGWLASVGVNKGDRVLVFMQNCPQFIAAVYAILRADAVVVPVNPMNRADELAHFITDPEAKVAICSADLAAIVVAANESLPHEVRLGHVLAARYADAMPADAASEAALPEALRAWLRADPVLPSAGSALFTRWSDAIAARVVPPPSLARPDDMALLPYTSGTTGNPKGCVHTHRTLMHNTVAGQWGHHGPESVSLGVVPMFHITGMIYGVLGAPYAGSTTVIMPRWEREWARRLIREHCVTHWTCIPTMIIDLLASPEFGRADLASLRYLGGGGAAMPHAVAERLRDEFGLAFAEGYGLTETAGATHANPPERAKLQCLGMPVFGTDSRIVDPLTLAELPPGETGEIVSAGPMLFKGYWGQPEATAAAFVELDGKRWFRTGDLGRVDEEGYFFLTDRLKRMINASGFKVWPAEVELMLYKHPAVQEACVIAARDAYRGQTVKALVVLREHARGTTRAEDIIGWSREHMAAYKVPRRVEFVASLPKSGSGKVMWRALQEREDQANSAV